MVPLMTEHHFTAELWVWDARLTSELAAARENEARYLWLRDQGHVGPHPMPYARIAFGYTAEELDAIVDAARRAGEGEK